MKIKDLSPFPVQPTAEEEAWLGRLQRHLVTSDHVVRLGEATDRGGGQIVTRDSFGTWWAGRYVGEVSFEGRRLVIEPRLGMTVIEEWLSQALNLLAPPHASRELPTKSFIALLMAMVWSQRLAAASRHGPPAFRRERTAHGAFLRGRLDLRGTLALRERARPQIASVMRSRDLDNDVSRVIVRAERTLTETIGHNRWHTARVAEVLPTLRAAVGSRPHLPKLSDLRRVRYAPITRPFEQLAELSWRIAKLRGVTSGDDSGRSSGLLLDVAEIWELFVLNCTKRAMPELVVEHSAQSGLDKRLLRSAADDSIQMGRLKPDVMVRAEDRAVAVIDAKYKRLAPTLERPDGVDRGDLYQIVSYLARFAPTGAAPGLLVYPLDPDQSELSKAELQGPWLTAGGSSVRFLRLPVDRESAVDCLASIVTP